jgi:hypothetical protein
MLFHQSLPLLAVTALLAGCSASIGGEKAGGAAGPDGSRSFAASGFTGVELAGADTVEIKQGSAFSVVATGPQDVLDRLEVVVDGDMLVIRRKVSKMGWSVSRNATVTVTMPVLTKAEVSGSGDLTADRAAGDAVAVSLSGSGDLTLTAVEAKTLAVSVAGSGDLKIAGGKAASGDFGLAGSGDIAATGLSLTDASVSLAGSGDVALTATGAVKASIAGSGDIRVVGGAKCDSSTIGSGEVTCG